MTMATGQIANVLYQGKLDPLIPIVLAGRIDPVLLVPYRFPGLTEIGIIFLALNIVLFVFNAIMISIRFRLYAATFQSSLRHPTESLFVPASVISLGTILITITQYGLQEQKSGFWLVDVMVVFFWIYCAVAMTFSCGIYLTL